MENLSVGSSRSKRRFWVYTVSGLLGLLITLALLWALRNLILPSVVGALGAYLCRPILTRMHRVGISGHFAVVVLFGGFFLIVVLLTQQIQAVMPTELGKLELRTRIQYKINDQYKKLMGLDEDGKGNFLNSAFGGELRPLVDKVNSLAMLDLEERKTFIRQYMIQYGPAMVTQKYFIYFQENQKVHRERLGKAYVESPTDAFDPTQPETPHGNGAPVEPAHGEKSLLSKISSVVSLWLASPFVFLFLIVDEGEIKRNLVYLVPNRYFEMTLTVINEVDQSIGNYLRGTMLECSLVGLSFGICMFLIGVDLQWAMLIGLIAGVTNAIPFLGTAIGLVVGLAYALLVEDFSPILPFVDAGSIPVWVVVSVGVVHLLDNILFQPIVLGTAVSLHPIVVIIGVMGGSILLGLAGMLFAVPAIVVVKVFVSTSLKQLKAYRII